MTTLAATASGLFGTSSRQDEAADVTVEIARTLAEAEPAWRELERDAVMAPYGRFDWIATLLAHLPPSSEVVVALVRDGAGRASVVMPLQVDRSFGIRVATAIGGKHVNFNLPLIRPDLLPTLTQERTRALLCRIGQALRVDAFAWPNVPTSWSDQPNPFAAGGRASPSNAWALRLDPDGEATLARSMSSEARKKLRNKSRGLAKLGPVALLEGRDPETVDRILDAFFAQKETRFGELGIDDPFAEAGMRAFIREAALPRRPSEHSAIELFGLGVGDRIVAVLGGAADPRRLSGMFVSFEQGDAAKFSPGEILVTEIIRLQCARGRRVFDLGVGDARYKRSICDEVENLVDVVVPVTARGRLYTTARHVAVDLKRRVKASPRGMALVARARRLKAALRG